VILKLGLFCIIAFILIDPSTPRLRRAGGGKGLWIYWQRI
jgi:hypothetical protein